ncbi:hypothetical protein [Streptomyces sp. NPDC051567]|uniref:hypothetical protein n=1 Tax=Streptomyces sp. NPDC051567 TaxID=3365660 RepID=UPI0037B741AD
MSAGRVPEHGAGERVEAGGRGGRWAPVAAWAWLWRDFDMALPEAGGAARQKDGVPAVRRTASAAGAGAGAAAESEGYARYAAHGPW